MKKFVASVGVVALGAAGAGAVDSSIISQGSAKPWSVSAALRGFYDDNPGTLSGAGKTSSFGYSLSPGMKYGWADGPTSIKFDYTYTYIYFDKRFGNQLQKYDQDHTFNFNMDHAFNERYQLNVTDSFVVGQEPDTLSTGVIGAPQRLPGDNIRNTGAISFNAQITPLFGLLAGYQNSFFHYHASGAQPGNEVLVFGTNSYPVSTVTPSAAGRLNRFEHTLHLDARWQALPETVGVLGYQFGLTDFTANEAIGVLYPNGIINGAPITLMSSSRNSRTHSGYAGLDHRFTPDLQAQVRVGVQDTDYYNDPSQSSALSPYVNATLSYNYGPENSLQLGFSYNRSASDQVSPSLFGSTKNTYTTGQESANLFGTLHHRILSHLYGSLTGQFQDSSFVGGAVDGQTEKVYLFGLEMEYRFNPNFAATFSYDYDKVQTGVAGLSYDRNRIFLGVTASY